jgi:hypothetical protein
VSWTAGVVRAAPDRDSWLVEFDLDGERAVAVFPAELEPGATLAEPALKVGRKRRR